MTLYEDATQQLATQVAEDTLDTLKRSDIDALTVEMAKTLERGADGSYAFRKPAKKKKERHQCLYCPKKVVHLERHIINRHPSCFKGDVNG